MKIFLALTLALVLSGCTGNLLPDSATVAIEYGSQPNTKWDNAVSEDVVKFSARDTPTASLYEVTPENATLHDLLEFWSLEFGSYNGTVGEFGFFLQDINGVAGFYDDAGTPNEYEDDFGAYWQVFVAGEALEVGLSSVAAEDGIVVKFVYTTYGNALA